MTSNLQGTVLVTGGAGGIGTGWLTTYLLSPQAQTHHTIFIIHPLFPGQLRSLLSKSSIPNSQFEIIELDLSLLSSVREFALKIRGRIERNEIPRLSLLLLIAGNMFLEPLSISESGVGFTSGGFEKTWALNYGANVVLIFGLLRVMGSEEEGRGRVVWLASTSHDPSFKSNRGAYWKPEMQLLFKDKGDVERIAKATNKIEKGDEFPAAVRRYGTSKLSMTMFTYALQRRLSSSSNPTISKIQILANSPGCVGGTALTSSMPWYIRYVMQYALIPLQALSVLIWGNNGSLRTAKVAGEDLDWCCWSEEFKGGEYVDGRVVITSSPESLDVEKQERNWMETGELLGLGEEMKRLGDGK